MKAIFAGLILFAALNAQAQSKADGAAEGRERAVVGGITFEQPVSARPIRFDIVQLGQVNGDGDFDMIGTDNVARLRYVYYPGSSTHKIIYYNSKGVEQNAYYISAEAAQTFKRTLRGVSRQCSVTITVKRPELFISKVSANCDQAAQLQGVISADDAG